jgi:hypothetical protein
MKALRIFSLFLAISFSSYSFANDKCVAGPVLSYSTFSDGYFSSVLRVNSSSSCRIAIIAHRYEPAYNIGSVDISNDISNVHMVRAYIGGPQNLRRYTNKDIYKYELKTVASRLRVLKQELIKAGQEVNADYSKCLVSVLYALPTQTGIKDQLVQQVVCE